jgi:putative hemolysin
MFTILIIIILTLVNAFFAASEMALVSIKPSTMYRIKQSGHKNSGVLEKVTKDSTKYLSTIQVAITFSGFLSSAFAGSQLAHNLVDLFSNIYITLSNSLAVVIITMLLSFFILVFGELVPKRIALSKSIKIALFSAPIIYVVMKVFAPFVWLLTLSTKAVIKIFRIKQKQEDHTITEKEIKEMIVFGNIEGLSKKQELDILERVFIFDDLKVNEIMTNISEAVCIDIRHADDKAMDLIIESKYSRIPVYETNKNNIIGVILVKDILNQLYKIKDFDINIKQVLRKSFVIKGSTKISELFKKMKQEKEHMAFVSNEKDKIIGIVTLEDIIEEIVGDIFDEHDK